MSKKILAFDVETTGLDPVADDIVQLSALMIVDGEVVSTFNESARPSSEANLKKITENEGHPLHHISSEVLMAGMPEVDLYFRFVNNFLLAHLDKYDKTDKAYPMAYNGHFDLDFLSALFKRNNDKYLGSFLNWKLLDPRPIINLLDYRGSLSLPNYKLATVAEHFGIHFQAHDALADIGATWALWNIVHFLISQPLDCEANVISPDTFRRFCGVTEQGVEPYDPDK